MMVISYYLIVSVMLVYVVWLYFSIDTIRLIRKYKHINLIRIFVKVDCLLIAFNLLWLLSTSQFDSEISTKNLSYLFLDFNVLALAVWHWYDSIRCKLRQMRKTV